MFNVPPPAAKTHWVYDDPSGVPEGPLMVPNRVVRVSHMEN